MSEHNNLQNKSSIERKTNSHFSSDVERDRAKMLREVQSLEFALHEAVLFLDINNNDKKALKYFNHYKPLAKEARDRFESRYGPLQSQSWASTDKSASEHWKWTDGPWPWEYTSDGKGG